MDGRDDRCEPHDQGESLMAKTTTWSRIEPSAQTADIEQGLAAGVADPMWFLARQLQLGEFKGDDGGSPIGMHLRASWSSLTRFHAGPLPEGAVVGTRFDPVKDPLEAVVEREQRRHVHSPDGVGWADRVHWGSGLEDELRRAGKDAVIALLRSAFPFDPGSPTPAEGPAERRYRVLLAGRVLDGAKARAGLAGGQLPAQVAASPLADAALRTAIEAWFTWLGVVAPEADPAAPGSSWIPERLEYAFAVAAPGFGDGEIVLEAAEYDGTGVDWYSVDQRKGASLGAAADAVEPQSVVRHVLPQPVRYPGMPADRYWQMEDGHVNLGAIGAGPTDLARMLAVEYAIVYGPDWFVVPLELPVGAVARVDWVVVRDTFGATVVVGTHASQAADQAGRQFQLATTESDVADVPLLFLPSASGPTVRGRSLERLTVLRDELANLVWGIEQVVLGPTDQPVDLRGNRKPAELAALPLPDLTDELRVARFIWQLATPAPEGWVPMVVVNDGTPMVPKLRLRRAALLDTIDEAARVARGQLLAEIGDLFEEEVGRAGLDVTLLDQVGRWVDGSLVSWRGREKRPGRGEAESRLFFDRVDPWQPPAG
jgi:hypothetical protein